MMFTAEHISILNLNRTTQLMVRLDWRMLVGCLYLLFKVQSHHTDHYEEEYDHAHHDEAEEHPQHVHLDKINEVTCFFAYCCLSDTF